MIRSFKYPLLLNEKQASVLEAWLEKCRLLYNAALEQRRDAYRLRGVTLTRFDQQKGLTELRASDADWKDVPVEVERSALSRLQKAFDGFFRRVKRKQKPGFPRFKGNGWYDSFSFPGNTIKVEGNRVVLPRLGAVKFYDYRNMKGKVLEVTVRRTSRRWTVSFACDVGEAPVKVVVKSAAGIDLGLTSFAVLSNGEEVQNPRFFKASEEKIADLQRRLQRKIRGSNSRKRLKLRIAREHERIKDRRLDFSRKLACALFEKYDLVAHEDLNVRGLAQSFLSKSIHDVSWRVFLNCLTFKAENAGKWCVPVDSKNTTKKCSSCGALVTKSLSERMHICACGLVLGRDHNAALNIVALGSSALEVQGRSPK